MSDDKDERDAEPYDCAYRLREIRDMYSAVAPAGDENEGRMVWPGLNVSRHFPGWEETADPANAAHVAVKRKLRDALPAPELPKALEPGKRAAVWEVLWRLELVLRMCAEMNTVLCSTTEEEFPRSYREGLQNTLFDIMFASDVFWQSINADNPRLTMTGKFLNAVLAGYDPGKLQFSQGQETKRPHPHA